MIFRYYRLIHKETKTYRYIVLQGKTIGEINDQLNEIIGKSYSGPADYDPMVPEDYERSYALDRGFDPGRENLDLTTARQDAYNRMVAQLKKEHPASNQLRDFPGLEQPTDASGTISGMGQFPNFFQSGIGGIATIPGLAQEIRGEEGIAAPYGDPIPEAYQKFGDPKELARARAEAFPDYLKRTGYPEGLPGIAGRVLGDQFAPLFSAFEGAGGVSRSPFFNVAPGTPAYGQGVLNFGDWMGSLPGFGGGAAGSSFGTPGGGIGNVGQALANVLGNISNVSAQMFPIRKGLEDNLGMQALMPWQDPQTISDAQAPLNALSNLVGQMRMPGGIRRGLQDYINPDMLWATYRNTGTTEPFLDWAANRLGLGEFLARTTRRPGTYSVPMTTAGETYGGVNVDPMVDF